MLCSTALQYHGGRKVGLIPAHHYLPFGPDIAFAFPEVTLHEAQRAQNAGEDVIGEKKCDSGT